MTFPNDQPVPERYATLEGEMLCVTLEEVGAMPAYGAFENLEPTFTPTPTTPDLQTIHEAFAAPDANEWTVAMDDEIKGATLKRSTAITFALSPGHKGGWVRKQWIAFILCFIVTHMHSNLITKFGLI